jgi:hypothetical protein
MLKRPKTAKPRSYYLSEIKTAYKPFLGQIKGVWVGNAGPFPRGKVRKYGDTTKSETRHNISNSVELVFRT